MPLFTFSVYTGFPGFSQAPYSGPTVTFVVEDDDSTLEDTLNMSPQTLDSSLQILDQDVTIGGTTYLAGSKVTHVGHQPFENKTTGETGTMYSVQVNGVNVGHTTTIPVCVGDVVVRTAGGHFLGNAEYSTLSLDVCCFCEGVSIQMDNGQELVENLAVGNRIETKDHGLQQIRWIGKCEVDAEMLRVHPRLRPILIREGALGKGVPERDLRVSPQHRVLVRSKIAKRMFGTSEVLIAANKLVELDGIEVDMSALSVNYFHILFDNHELVYSNGALTESLFTGPEMLNSVSAEAYEEITMMFPEVQTDQKTMAVRHIPEKGRLAKQLVHRHAKNRKVLQEIA